jgi:mannitol/fructose-specific phosphotransferase system IIA component (Ntr-type)
MRESKIRTYKPTFRSPLYPWIQIFAIVAYGFLIFAMGTVSLAITGGFVALGFAWYALYARKRVSRQSALIHIVERIADREIGSETLESELKDIIIERDNIVEDRFDRLIKQSEVIDEEGPLNLEEFFRHVAEAMSSRLGMSAGVLFDLLMKRETESTTVIQPGLAIPHIIVEGTGKFDILLARCRQGITFAELCPLPDGAEGAPEQAEGAVGGPRSLSPVRIVFVLAGSHDQRNFHLRALMAIAQVVRQADFEKDWLNASDLRNIILLATREREAL